MVLEGTLVRVESGFVEALNGVGLVCLGVDGPVDRAISSDTKHVLEHQLAIVDGERQLGGGDEGGQ